MDLIPDRSDYGDRSLSADDLQPDPLRLFEEWLGYAVEQGVAEANAVCLSTIGLDGCPDSRVVLLKGIEQQAVRFYTNYGSSKARQMAENPLAAMVMWWEPLKRQVRFRGRIEMVEQEISEEYFSTRPRESQLGAWASRQSEPIPDREVLQERLKRMDEKFPDSVPRPDFWGGYRLKPFEMEFWQGRTSRLHDRFRYRLQEDGTWSVQRLMP